MLSPKFFTDARLCVLSPLTRILFAGLWGEADREGRLADSPVDLKIRILPMDEADVDKMLNSLAGVGLVERYEVAGKRYLWITNFLKHQHPHHLEANSTIPAPGSAQVKPRVDTGKTVDARPKTPLEHPSNTRISLTESVTESESVTVQKPAGKKPPAAPKPGPDPLHAPLMKALVDAVPYDPDWGRDAKQVTLLLAKAKGDPLEVMARWKRAWSWPLNFPRVRTLTELVSMWSHFATDTPAGKGPVDPSTQTHTRTGVVENFGEQL